MVPERWDIFCRIVDNFGDLGVCWRLARQLANEHGARVRLMLDDPAPFHLIAPQGSGAVDVRPWPSENTETPEVADVVIAAFACELPPAYLAALSAKSQESAPPCLINLEYLSAEDWIEGCHGLASPHPILPLATYFFFPGFTAKSGGLLRERDIFTRRQTLCRKDFLFSLGIEDSPAALLLTLFCYDNAPLAALIAVWQEAPCPILCLVPPGQPFNALCKLLGKPSDTGWQIGNVRLLPIPFLSQEIYDALLFISDFNFVRGEDSFVRAQWAGKPFVWQAYPQTDNAHHAKLSAFAERYRPHPLLLDFWRFWNGAESDAAMLRRFWYWLCNDRTTLDDLTLCARNWRAYLTAQEDLTTRLIRFCAEKQGRN